jgi:hypothetical protein
MLNSWKNTLIANEKICSFEIYVEVFIVKVSQYHQLCFYCIYVNTYMCVYLNTCGLTFGDRQIVKNFQCNKCLTIVSKFKWFKMKMDIVI